MVRVLLMIDNPHSWKGCMWCVTTSTTKEGNVRSSKRPYEEMWSNLCATRSTRRKQGALGFEPKPKRDENTIGRSWCTKCQRSSISLASAEIQLGRKHETNRGNGGEDPWQLHKVYSTIDPWYNEEGIPQSQCGFDEKAKSHLIEMEVNSGSSNLCLRQFSSLFIMEPMTTSLSSLDPTLFLFYTNTTDTTI